MANKSMYTDRANKATSRAKGDFVFTQKGDGTEASKGTEVEVLLASVLDNAIGDSSVPIVEDIKNFTVTIANKTNTKAYQTTIEKLSNVMQWQTGQGIYGLMYRDNGTDFTYTRTGKGVEGYTEAQAVPETLLTVHNKMKRCVTKDDGTVNYYLNPTDSIFKEGTTTGITGSISSYSQDYGAGTITVTPSSQTGLSTDIIGCYLKFSNGVRDDYALITGYDGSVITLAHPHHTMGVGYTKFEIGDAKLNGADGQVMVEIPEFYWKCSEVFEAGYTWIHHQISLEYFDGAIKLEKRYISAFEGVAGDASGVASNGWSGTWDMVNNVWTSISNTSVTNKLLSVAGFYPQTSRTRANFRTQANAVGALYNQYDFMSNFIIQLLMLIESGGFGSQERIARGITDTDGTNWSSYNGYRPIRKTGDSIRYGNATGNLTGLSITMPLVSNYTIQSFSYRGIENPYGHIWKWVDAINLKHFAEGEAIFAKAYISADPRTHIDDTSINMNELPTKIYTHANSSSTNRFLKNLSKNFLPTDSVGASGSDKFVKDYFYVSDYSGLVGMWRVLAVGGGADNASYAGAWYWGTYFGSGDASVGFGGRLCKKA